MNPPDAIKNIFPAVNELPLEKRLDKKILQKEYLINGEHRKWPGPFQEVLSPVCLNKNSVNEQVHIGSYPLLTEKEALNALDAAVRAYDYGRGKWPTMPVEQRIFCMEEFIFRMNEKKDEVVKILMWEIGKSWQDADKEFTRTVEYIRDTIGALKELDRNSSRLVIEQGIIGQIRRAPLGVVLCMGPLSLVH